MKQIIKNVIFLALSVTILMINNACRTSPQAQTKTTEELPSELEETITKVKILQEQKEVADLKQYLESHLELRDELLDVTDYIGISDIFSFRAKNILKGEKSDSLEIRELAQKLRKKTITYQKKVFPILRREYAKTLRNKWWEHDLYVRASGNNSQYLNLSAIHFVYNKNKKDFANGLSSELRRLRFTQIRFRLYSDDYECTYYDMYEGKDGDIVE